MQASISLTYDSDASLLQSIRKTATLQIPNVIASSPNLEIEVLEPVAGVAPEGQSDVQQAFPSTFGGSRISLKVSSEDVPCTKLRIGVVLSGGQAPGGHNVIVGIYDEIKKRSPDSVLIGFLDGPHGIYSNRFTIMDDAMVNNYRNTGGFDMIGSGRHKIEKPDQFASSMANCTALDLDGLVVIGGDDSNTNAALLAEYFAANNCKTKVCGCPKTIDGDLKVHPYIPVSFGFDTACRTYSELIGNLGQDTLSSQKYYHFVRLMGRSASHIALECALQTRPNVCLIGEEVDEKKMTLSEITNEIVSLIVRRAEMGKNYGLVLIPEGLIDFIPEFRSLIAEINDVLADGTESTEAAVAPRLNAANRAAFDYLPGIIKQQLLLDRDPHGNVQVAKIETEKLLAHTIDAELAKLRAAGAYAGRFDPQFHSYGYEGRSCLPSPFDATYCYALGRNVASIISHGFNGLISSVTNLAAPVSEWGCGGVPITMMCNMEKRHGHMKPVIKKAMVELDGLPFKVFASQRSDWGLYDLYRSPGPLQFYSESDSVELCITLSLELLGSDPRMDPQVIDAAKAREARMRRFGSFTVQSTTPSFAESEASLFLSQAQNARRGFQYLVTGESSTTVSSVTEGSATQCSSLGDRKILNAAFPQTYGAKLLHLETAGAGAAPTAQRKVGVAFLGRQAPGGHDVVKALTQSEFGIELYGFVGGTSGLLGGHRVVIDSHTVDAYAGQGGYDMLSRSTESIEASMYPTILANCNDLDAIVLIGSTRTCTAAAELAEYVVESGSKLQIIVVPADATGSLKSHFLETTLGFDTATKVASQVVGNNATDGASAKKYWYFMRLMGQSPSHTALEVALQTKPNYVILSEEVTSKHMSLADVVKEIADVVQARAAANKNYGTVLIPEGIIEAIPELKALIAEIDAMFAVAGAALTVATVQAELSVWSSSLFTSMPSFMQEALLHSRGVDNSFPVSQAETERLLAHFVEMELKYRKKKGVYTGSFSVVSSFIGYQSRGSLPSNFDVKYARHLGAAAATLIQLGGTASRAYNGYMVTVSNLSKPVDEWRLGAVPLTALLAVTPSGLPAVPISRVNLNGQAYAAMRKMMADKNAADDHYTNPGPLQFQGPAELTESGPAGLYLESSSYFADIAQVEESIKTIQEAYRPGCSPVVLSVAAKSLATLAEVVTAMEQGQILA